MKEIQRLLDIGETRLASDEYLTMAHEWRPLGSDNRFRPGDVQTLAHHATRRRERVIFEADLPKEQMRQEFTKAALTGLCSDQNLIADAMKKTAGGSEFALTDVIGSMAVQFGDAALKRMEVQK